MAALSLPRARAGRRRLPFWSWFWLAAAALYFLVPLYATLEFSLQVDGHYGVKWYSDTLGDAAFRDSLWLSLRLAIEAIVISLALMVPTVYIVHLRMPRLRPLVEFVSLLPLLIPPIALVVGVIDLFSDVPEIIASTQILAFLYVIQALPFTYRALDAGMRAVDIKTLTEAAESVGAPWWRTLLQVIVPNLRSAMLAAAFLTLATALGEYTIASLLLFNNFGVYIQYIGTTQAYQAAALTIISFGFTWLAMLALLWVSRRFGNRQTIAVGGMG
jgi:putative spermidine/putrescine transport system permease protein